ncbi:MAG: T9SS type A sorting domain-containing protein [Bacteroidota bacterium]
MPDNSSLNWYGSGDINNDNRIDWNDLYRLDSMLSGLFSDLYSNQLVDRSDINGDQFLSTDDRELLKEYLDGTTKCLPAHWNCLDTKEERIDWLEKVITIDRTEEELDSYDYPGSYYADQLFINLHGIEDALLSMFSSPPINYEHNGRFNLPVTYAGIFYNRPDLKVNRDLLAIVIGDNVFDWSDWCYIDPQWDQLIFPADDGEPAGDESFPPLNSWLDDINNITQRDTTPPSIELNYMDDSVSIGTGYFNLDYILSDINLKEAVYYMDSPLETQLLFKDSLILDATNDRLIPVFDTTGTIHWKLTNGQYSFGLEAHDHFFNKVSREFQLSVNDPPPQISILSPVEDSSYTQYLPLFDYSIEESDFSNAWYTIDSGQTMVEIQQEGDFILYLENGTYQLVMIAEDEFGNLGMDTVKFSIDVQDPIINPGMVEDSVLFVYPNPVTDIFYVLVPSGDTIVKMDIQDSGGKVLWELSMDNPASFNNRFMVDLSGHPQGIYFLKCYFETGKRIMTKVIKL